MARGGHLYAVDGDFDHSAEPSGQAMPCDLEAERAILGAVMVSSRAAGTALLLKLRDQLDGSDFYLPGHELIWNSLCELSDANCPTDPVSVADHLGTAELAKLGGGAYLHTCLNAVITPENSLWHAQIVKDLAAARSTVTVGARLMQIGRTPMEHGDLRGIVRAAVQPLLDIGSRNWPAPSLCEKLESFLRSQSKLCQPGSRHRSKLLRMKPRPHKILPPPSAYQCWPLPPAERSA
jgi:replicative DNA helicase